MLKPITRRSLITSTAAASLATPAVLSRQAWADGRSISVGTYNGPLADYVRHTVIPKFAFQMNF